MRKNKNFKIYYLFIIVLLFLFTWIFNSEGAEIYPNKPVRIVVPFVPGGSLDLGVRVISTYVGKYLGAPIVVENMPGADGIIGYTSGYTAKADGYNLMAGNIIGLVLTELTRETKYKTLEFKPVFAFTKDSAVLVVHAAGPKTFQEFDKMAHTREINVGSTGLDSLTGLMGLFLEEALGVKFNWIPFKGGAESLSALAGQHIDAALTVTSSGFPLVKAGKIRPLVIFSEKRHLKYQGVPVSKEMGINVPLLFTHAAVQGPPPLPDDKVNILEKAFLKSVGDPAFLEWLETSTTLELDPLSSKEVKKEYERYFTVLGKYTNRIKSLIKR